MEITSKGITRHGFQNYLMDMLEEKEILSRLGARVIAAREGARLRQTELADRVNLRLREKGYTDGMTRSSLSQIERGSSRPSLRSLLAIAEELNLELVIEFANPGENLLPVNASLSHEKLALLVSLGELIASDPRAAAVMESMLGYLKPEKTDPPPR